MSRNPLVTGLAGLFLALVLYVVALYTLPFHRSLGGGLVGLLLALAGVAGAGFLAASLGLRPPRDGPPTWPERAANSLGLAGTQAALGALGLTLLYLGWRLFVDNAEGGRPLPPVVLEAEKALLPLGAAVLLASFLCPWSARRTQGLPRPPAPPGPAQGQEVVERVLQWSVVDEVTGVVSDFALRVALDPRGAEPCSEERRPLTSPTDYARLLARDRNPDLTRLAAEAAGIMAGHGFSRLRIGLGLLALVATLRRVQGGDHVRCPSETLRDGEGSFPCLVLLAAALLREAGYRAWLVWAETEGPGLALEVLEGMKIPGRFYTDPVSGRPCLYCRPVEAPEGWEWAVGEVPPGLALRPLTTG